MSPLTVTQQGGWSDERFNRVCFCYYDCGCYYDRGRKAGEGGFECVTTYGRNKEHCRVAGMIGDFLKFKVMDWDKDGGS